MGSPMMAILVNGYRMSVHALKPQSGGCERVNDQGESSVYAHVENRSKRSNALHQVGVSGAIEVWNGDVSKARGSS